MTDTSIKQALLDSIQSAFEANKGLTASEIVPIIVGEIADATEVEALATDKLATPKIVADMITALGGGDNGDGGAAVQFLNFGLAENAAYISRDPAAFTALKAGIYQGYTTASTLELTAETITVLGVAHDPVATVEINVVKNGDKTYVSRAATVGTNRYFSELRSGVVGADGKCGANWTRVTTHWDNIIRDFRYPTHATDLTSIFQQVGMGLGNNDPATTPDATKIVATPHVFEHSAYRTFNGGVYFVVYPTINKWYVLAATNRIPARTFATQPEFDEWVVTHGHTVLSSGTIVTDGTVLTSQLVQVKVDVVSGTFFNRLMSPGSWVDIDPGAVSPFIGVELTKGAADWEPIRISEGVLRISFRNESTAAETSTTVRLAALIDQRTVPSTQFAPFGVGTWSFDIYDDQTFPLFDGELFQGNELSGGTSDAGLMLAVGRTDISPLNPTPTYSLLPNPVGLVYDVHEASQPHLFSLEVAYRYLGTATDDITTIYDCDLVITHNSNTVHMRVFNDSGYLALANVDGEGNLTPANSNGFSQAVCMDTTAESFVITGKFSDDADPARHKGLQCLFPGVTGEVTYAANKKAVVGTFDVVISLTHKEKTALGDTSHNVTLTAVVDAVTG